MRAEYSLNLRNSNDFADTIAVAFEIFDALKARGVERVYCTAGSQTAFNFNEHLGFVTTNVSFSDKYEVMVKEL